jgi:predicted porin
LAINARNALDGGITMMRPIKGQQALVALAMFAGTLAAAPDVRADSTQDQQQRLQQQLQQMQQQMQQLQQQLNDMSKKQSEAASAGPPVSAAPAPASKAKKEGKEEAMTPFEKKVDTFLKGFYGSLDVSFDATTKGIYNPIAYPWSFTAGPGTPLVHGGPKIGPYGNVGWIGAVSSNGSSIGYRGSHKIPNTDVNFIYQVSSAINMTAAPGLQNTWTKSSNTVQGALGLGDTFIGFSNHEWGRVRIGEMFMPYKTSTDRLNPFGTGLGNYAVIMGNTGGDNRVEFGTRSDHVIDYSSPNMHGFSFDVAWAPGQQIDPNNNLPSLGSVDCNGSNNPGSGNLFLNCDDGGYNSAYSADLKFETGGLYLVAAWELHERVNRSSDGIGSNNPLYGYYFGQGANGPNAYLLDWADYQAYANEYPGAAAAGSPAYSTAYDVANEWAMKFGGQYTFDFGLSIDYLWEEMKRDVPPQMQFQNERQRNGMWLAAQQSLFNGRDVIAVGWAHAGRTPGDPGGQHNYNPTSIDDHANMYTVQLWHKFDKQFTWYFDWAETINSGNSHYDIGAGGHGIKTDCHDATHASFIDYSSAGPTTWGGCHDQGLSTGVSYRF